MKRVPYNTGKVLIGCRYEPRKSSHVTPEDDLWQSVLLGDYGHFKRESVHMVFYVVGLLGVMCLIGWLV